MCILLILLYQSSMGLNCSHIYVHRRHPLQKKVDKRFPSVSQTRSRFFHVPLAPLLSCHPPPTFTRPPSVTHVHRKVPPGWTYACTYIVYTALSSQCAVALFEFRHSFENGCGFSILFRNLEMKITDVIIFVTLFLCESFTHFQLLNRAHYLYCSLFTNSVGLHLTRPGVPRLLEKFK